MVLTAFAFLGFLFVLASVLACPALITDKGKGKEGAMEILHMAAGGAGLKGDDLHTLGPIRDSLAHRTRSRNMLT